MWRKEVYRCSELYPLKVESFSKNDSKKGGSGSIPNSQVKGKSITFFKYGQSNHYMNECPKNKNDAHTNFVNEEEKQQTEDIKPKYDDDVEQE